MDQITLQVPNISCGHCVSTIQRALTEEVKGVTGVEGDPTAKQVTITYGPPATVDRIAEVMADWGYPPER